MPHFLFAFACLVLLASPSSAHDSWINKGGYKSAIGEWCCGEGDCARMDPDAVKETAKGIQFNGLGRIGSGNGEIVERYNEMVPTTEVMPLSRDGHFWRCKRQDGSRRCVFGPPPGS